MQFELRRLQRDLGITTVMVTHDQNEAMAMSDRIAVMRAGQIVQVDTPRAAYEHPADDFASTFLGKSNNISGQVGGGEIVLPGGVRMPAPRGRGRWRGAVLVAAGEAVGDAGCGRGGSGRRCGRAVPRQSLAVPAQQRIGELLVYQQNTNHAPPEEGDSVGVDWHPSSLRVLPPERP